MVVTLPGGAEHAEKAKGAGRVGAQNGLGKPRASTHAAVVPLLTGDDQRRSRPGIWTHTGSAS